MKRIIVSGANGFLGSHIVQTAREKNVELVLITTKSTDIPGATPVNTATFLEKGFPCGAEDVFINCLFPTNADGYRMANGLEKVYRMIDMARKSGVGAFINISSQSVYASKRTAPARETDPLSLETPYAVGKFSSEAYTKCVFRNHAFTNIRMASLLGVGYDQRIVNRMAEQALRGEELKVIGGMQRYGFLDVSDAASGLVVLAMSDPAVWQEIYNLGRNESCTLMDVVSCIAAETKKLTGRDVTCRIEEGSDTRNSAVDASRFMEDFSWHAEKSFAETTADILKDKWERLKNK